jgi:hypothetical protein
MRYRRFAFVLQHQDIEYSPVALAENKGEIWLPSSTEMYMDFLGHRFYRRHSLTDGQVLLSESTANIQRSQRIELQSSLPGKFTMRFESG